MSRDILKGSTDQRYRIKVLDADGLPATGLAYNETGIAFWYQRLGGAKTAITLAAGTGLTDTHSDGKFNEVGDGVYQIDSPDAAFSSGSDSVAFGGTITDYIVLGVEFPLVGYDPSLAIPTAAQISSRIAVDIEEDENNWDVALFRINDATSAKIAGDIDNDANGWAGAKGGIAAAVWDIATASLTTVGSIGKYIVDTFTVFGEAFTLLFQRVTGLLETKSEADTRQTVLLTAIGDIEGGGGDATLAKQNEILTLLQNGVNPQVTLADNGTLVVYNGRKYGGSAHAAIAFPVTKDYSTATSVRLVWFASGDVSDELQSATAVVVSSTLINISTTIAIDLVYEGCVPAAKCGYSLIANWSGDEETIATGESYVFDQP